MKTHKENRLLATAIQKVSRLFSNKGNDLMSTKDFVEKHKPCGEGKEFALQFETMAEAWEKCGRHDWLFLILREHKPLTKEQSIELIAACAESISYLHEEKKIANKEARRAAKICINNPSENNYRIAENAAWAAIEAARAADATKAVLAISACYGKFPPTAYEAARSASYVARIVDGYTKENVCDIVRSVIPNPFL